MLKKVAFTIYPVIDIKRARHFYENTLGIVVSKISANGSWIEYDLPESGCFAITTLTDDFTPNMTSGGCIAFEVDNIDDLTLKLKTQGVKFKLDIMESPVCKMAIAIDSEGNAFAIHQLKKS